jgi:hypothetical protein
MQSTLTPQQQQSITELLANMTLTRALGSEDAACSIAAINLALSGRLSDDIPPCMSEVIGRWVIRTQDGMPAEMRNSAEWKRLLPLAAGTGREREQERAAIILSWMWEIVLPSVQPVADANGFGKAWKEMLLQRTSLAALAAADEADEADSREAALAASSAAFSASSAVAAAVATDDDAWVAFNPCGLLEKLINS